MDTIVSVASTIAQTVVPCIAREISYTLSYDKNLKKLKDEVQRLERTETDFKRRVEEAERNGDKIFDTVQFWQKEVEHTIAEANKLIDSQGACCLRKCSNSSKQFEEMTQEISRVIADGKFDDISYRVPSEVTITPSGRGYEALESRTSILNEIKEALKDPKLNMIGVHGMGGVGKTTLVKELAWQVKNDGSFGVAIIATVTHSPDVKKIQGQIADVLFSRKLEKESESGRAAELRERIKREKSVVIILDDIWRELDLAEVGIPFGNEHTGCKLVMTSRDLNVLKEMGSQKEFDLKALLDEDSWNLFQKIAGDVVEELDIKPIAEKVTKCCVGLPLLIVTVAKGLRRKDVTAWRDALTQLERSEHRELRNRVYPALKLSYDCLESELKPLFSFIGSFGRAIHNGDLFSYCWGLGFYGNMQTFTKGRDTHFKLLQDLKATSLLLESEPEWITMHDVVRDVAKEIAFEFHPTYAVKRFTELKEWPKVEELQNIVLESYIYQLPEMMECPELKLLVLINTSDGCLKVPDNFFSKVTEVRTLDLTHVVLTPSLLTSLRLLINLRSLTLCKCELGDIRIIAKFTNLEILSLEGSTIEELPKEIAHLTHLQLLNLTNCSQLRVIPANLISSLTRLEELYMGNCSIQWEDEGSKSETSNASLGELRNLHQLTTLEISIADTSILPADLHFLAKLERYILLFGYMWMWSPRWCCGSRETSRILKLTNSWWRRIPLTSVKELSFSKLEGVNNLLYELDEEGFPQLKHLHIEASDELLYIINSKGLPNPHSAFPNLETLVLDTLNNVEEICHGPFLSHSFAKLKIIEVRFCGKLEKLLPFSVIRNLSQLQEMKICYCNHMTNIIAKEKQEDEKELPEIVLPELHSLELKELPMLQCFYLPLTLIKGNPSIQSVSLALFNQQVVMPKLVTLKLHNINTCKIWDDKLSVLPTFQNLSHLEVDGCDSLTSLFSSWVGGTLVKLQHLDIGNCCMLKEIFTVEKEVQFPHLETLYITDMSALKSVWPNQVVPNSFCNLSNIFIQNCENLDYIFPIPVVKDSDELLYIINSKGLPNPCSAFPNLETLVLHNLNNVEEICHGPFLSHSFAKLKVIEVSDCGKLEKLLSFSVIRNLSQLQEMKICNCTHMTNIIAKEKQEDEKELPEIVLPELHSLELKKLPMLQCFYLPLTIIKGNPSIQSVSLTLFNQQVVMPKLVTLKLHDINTCKIWDDKLSVLPTFQNLSHLEVDGCDSLTSLFSSWVGGTLVKLQHLKIRNCCMLKEIFAVQKEVQFPNLETLDIRDMPALKSIWLNQVAPNSFCKLSNIFTENCDNLEYIFPISVVKELRLLQKLEIIKCGIKNIVEESNSRDITLVYVEQLIIWGCKFMKTIVPSSVVFQSLDALYVRACDGVVNIITPSTNKCLPQLRNLTILVCKELEEIYGSRNEGDTQVLGEIAFMKLKRLNLRDLPRLRSFCQGSYDFNFRSLQMVYLDTCPMMVTFCHGNLTTPSLTKVQQYNRERHWDGDLNTTISNIFTRRQNAEQELSSLPKSEEEKEQEQEQEQEQKREDNDNN